MSAQIQGVRCSALNSHQRLGGWAAIAKREYVLKTEFSEVLVAPVRQRTVAMAEGRSIRMSDDATERLRLAKMVRELERQIKENTEAIFKPLFAHPDHVRHYFQAYGNYAARALEFANLPQRDAIEEALRTPLPVHRDNLGALSGRIGEVAAALEASTVDIERDLVSARAKAAELEASLGEYKEKSDRLEREREEFQSRTPDRRPRLLQVWVVLLGVAWALTLGWLNPGFAWVAALLFGVNSSLVAIVARGQER